MCMELTSKYYEHDRMDSDRGKGVKKKWRNSIVDRVDGGKSLQWNYTEKQ